MLQSMRARSPGQRVIKAQRKNKEWKRRKRSANNRRPPPFIISKRKLNIDQSKLCAWRE